MALKDVKCSECDHVTEVLIRPSTKPEEIRCEECDSTEVEPCVAPTKASFVLAGSGWAASGYSK